MRYDVIIVGGGIAGLTCGIQCQKQGLKTLILSAGQSALHFSSGSIDLYGRLPNGNWVDDPYQGITTLAEMEPNHPYSKLGETAIRESMAFIQGELNEVGLEFIHDERNHLRITPVGTLHRSWLSPSTVARYAPDEAVVKPIALATIEGFRDFHPTMAAANLKKTNIFRDAQIYTGEIRLSSLDKLPLNLHEFRSTDIARTLDIHNHIGELIGECNRIGGNASHIHMPACISLDNSQDHLNEMSRRSGYQLSELPTMPPSIPGMRMEKGLVARYKRLGGTFLAGHQVLKGEFEQGELKRIWTDKHDDISLSAKQFLLATGGFFSKGMSSSNLEMYETTFKLDVTTPENRDDWYEKRMFANKQHGFMVSGVNTDEQMRAYKDGEVINNLYCAGSILSHYDPVSECSGSGVGVASGYHAATQILTALKSEE